MKYTIATILLVALAAGCDETFPRVDHGGSTDADAYSDTDADADSDTDSETDTDTGKDTDSSTIPDDPCDLGGDIVVPTDQPTIQAAIVAATEGETICVNPGTYLENLDFLGKAIMVVGVDGPQNTIIDGGGTGTVVQFINGEGLAAVLKGFTVTHGYASYAGGGILMDGASPTLLDLHIVDNYAANEGAGLELSYSSPEIRNVIIEDNTADYAGGGMSLRYSSPTIENARIIGNYSGYAAGGVNVLYTSSPLLTNVVVIGNYADYEGGGVHMWNGAAITIVNGVFTGNLAGYEGGALSLDTNSTAVLTNVAITHNEASYEGGAFSLGEQPWVAGNVVQAYNCDIWNNGTSEYDGMASPVGSNGNISVNPGYLDTTDPDPLNWDYHLAASSALVGTGDTAILDPDGTSSDMGAYGGPGADDWDLDMDGYDEWWIPGSYLPATSPGMDCDDLDSSVFPGAGC